jgi:hypothetical protein
MEIPLRNVFDRPTVAGLAGSLLEQLLAEDAAKANEKLPDAPQAIADEPATVG